MQMLATWLVAFQAIRLDGGRSFKGVHLSQVHPLKVPLALLVHFLLWQAAKPSGDKCTP